ncbi:Oxygen-regulated protein 1 [Takifugu flavidus]|uniref:Oxygen-regulated protein 1 n=1 Tax=Takifugu flavidus TaxID=433684 RepID=A0A5C6P245_9TELE|nr:Oxygen-regulated protein 1 [Takifugu flavidus]
MSNTPPQEPPGPEMSFSSGQTLHSRPNQSMSDPSTSKRVCFYKSGDYKFSGHRMVINGRTFKTYDALLDALSKKVPLAFGVRTITTPRGTHLVKALDDLHDGGSYVCSDQKRVKPLNLEEVKRRQVPWNTTRPLSAGRRQRLQFGKRGEAANRPAKVTERVAVRTPKKLVVVSNRDPMFKRTIVLHRRSAPTFDALLDYLSQILQFPVLKLYSTDGRRVDGLAALILCSGVVVAASKEPFKLGNYDFHRGENQISQAMLMDTGSGLQPKTQRYIVEQVNKSQNGSKSGQLHHHGAPFEADHRHPGNSLEAPGADGAVKGQRALIVPHEDDIEKSFRVNEDGSMTVEMKVHLTIKEEEVLHWTTTLSRSSLSRKTVYASISESANSSPDSNNAVAKHSFSICEEETKEENCPSEPGRAVAFNKKHMHKGYPSATEKGKPVSRRVPTPGPRHVKKTASVESVTTVRSSGSQEHTLGHYSYMERMADGGTTEGYCLVRHSSSSSSSNRPVPKPRKTVGKDGSHAKRPSGVAEVLKIENNGMEPRKAPQPGKKTPSQDKSMATIASPKKLSGLSESFSRPSSLPPPCEVHKYVENWLEKVSSDRDPYSEEGFSDKSPPQEKVEFQIGGDSEENENDELCQSIVEQNAQHVTGLCAPPSSIRDGRAEHQEITLQTCIFAEAILSADHDAASAASKEKIKPIVQHICSAVQSIKRASDTNTPPSPDKTNSMDKFSNQVASVFGSSCKLFLSFLSVIILQDCITGGQSWGASEATMMMESLQKVSAAEDEEKQRVGLEDLRNKASFQLKKSWKDFMNLSDKTETETEITLSVKGVDVFEDQCLIIDELMGELNISQDLREVISSTVRLAPSFYPVEESTSLETEINQPDNANESEMGEEAGQGEVRDQMIANVQEEWETENDEQVGEELKQEMVVEVHHQWGKVKGRGTEESQGSEEELLEETEEEESNEETDEREAVEETEMEGDAFTEATEEGDEVEERLIGGTEDISEKDEIQTEGEDISDSGEEPVVFTGKDVVDNDNDQQGEEKVIEEKREEAKGENKKEDEVVEEGGQESAGDNYSMTTCQGEDEQESDQSIEQEGRYEDRKEVDEEGLDEDRESEVGLEEANVPNEAAEDLDMKINERANSDSKFEQTATEFPVKYSSEEHCEDDKGNGADTMTDDGEEHCDDRSNNLPHPVEISQELLDFVNSALQSSSLIFTYDAQGNVWLEPDNCRVVKTKQALIPKRSKDSQYGLKILPSPSTSDLSDYRPETSESWRSNPQESTDMATDSGEDTLERSVISKNKGETHRQKTNAEPANTGSSAEAFQNPQVESRGTISSFSSGIETPRESPPQAATEDTRCTSASLVEESPDGVLIDQGRWLLKENHLIRKSPPFSSGMYDNADSTSIDSGQENGEDTVTHTQAQLNPLTYFSSSEIEEMAKPKSPKCTYYKMPHGSDSDPFIDDGSLKIEFKMSDRKVHPEEESSAVVQARRTSSGGRRELQAQDSQDTLNLRCSPYCPIL